eukprot:4209108-Amphidinium_carterae.1
MVVCKGYQKDLAAVKTPEKIPRLLDLITTKDIYKVAFYFGVRHTLVAKDGQEPNKHMNMMNY